MKKTGLMVVFCLLFLASSNVMASVLTTMDSGGDRLVAMQYSNGAWGWPLTSPPTYSNIHGPIAMGLAKAYEATGDAGQYTALSNAGAYFLTKKEGNGTVADKGSFSASDGYLAYELDTIFGGTTYTDYIKAEFYDKLAAGTYTRAGVDYSTATYVGLIQASRAGTNMAAWDIGMGLAAAALVGADTTAWIAGTEAEINELNVSQYYDVLGLAGAIYGLSTAGVAFDPTAGAYAAAGSLQDLGTSLASYQLSTGGFTWSPGAMDEGMDNETIQETAYSILALNSLLGFNTQVDNAANYLITAQLGTGGWENSSGSGENNEVTGEALWAISDANPVPEPSTLLLLGVGLAGLVGFGRKQFKK